MLLDGVFGRKHVADGGEFTDADLYNDFVFKNGISSESLTLTLSGPGIAANTKYELTFYSYDSDSTQGSHSVDYKGNTGTTGSS